MVCSAIRPRANRVPRAARSLAGRLGPLLVVPFLLLVPSLTAAPAQAQPPVVVDGNIDDLIEFAGNLGNGRAGCGLVSNDPDKDVCKTDPGIVPCPTEEPCPLGAGTYFVNGFDARVAAIAFDTASNTAYLGFRVAGVIGDSNGDGDPGVGACANPNSNVQDFNGIAATESYIWLIDTNCDGEPEISVTVTSDQVVVDPPAGPTSVAYNGSDLEVSIEGLSLPPIWQLTTFVGSTTDGLSEDTSPLVRCPEPDLDLAIEKSANPTTLCPGEPTTFTITVENTGAAMLTVSLLDSLPAGLSFANAVSGDFSLQGVSGQEITFVDLEIPAGAVRTVSFQATADPECQGPVENLARVIGTFESACLEAPQGVGPVRATATVTCVDDPCVTVTADGPEAACVGDDVTIVGRATNCSADPEDITLVVAGSSQAFPAVAPGATVEHTATVPMPECEPGQSVSFDVTATATNVCGTDQQSASHTVRCLDEPCVEITARGRESACVGDTLTIVARATNCSADPEDITITIDGQSLLFEAVAPGASVEQTAVVTMPACEPGQSVSFDVSATAANACGTTEQATVHPVTCLDEPCVNVVGQGPADACVGDEITISGWATNCSADPEDITLTVAGTSETFLNVAPGDSVHLDVVTVMPACEPGQGVLFDVSATATNACGTTEQSTSVSVTCLDEPCVEVSASGPEAACVGDDVTIVGRATNCSADPEDITLTVAGSTQTFNDVAPGATVEHTATVPMPECEPGQSVLFDVTARAVNRCGETSAEASHGVRCLDEPCLELRAEGPPSACEGDEITISGIATNCSADPEDITITVAGDIRVFPAVAPGATVQHDVVVIMPACGDPEGATVFARTGGARTGLGTGLERAAVQGSAVFDVSATATNACGTTEQATTAVVACGVPPCLELTAEGPEDACVGDDVTLVGRATNCAADPVDITITVAGSSQSFPDVAPGATVEHTATVPMPECEPGQGVLFDVSATATNACGTTEQSTSVSVTCLDEPCVTVNGEAPEAACVGESFTISGYAVNCSADPEDITLTVAGDARVFENVAPGDTVRHGTTVSFPEECEPGQEISYVVSAEASNRCGVTGQEAELLVRCLAEPCVQVRADGPDGACTGEDVTISAWAVNCSEETEDIVVRIEDRERLFEDVAAGDTVRYEASFPMPECESGARVSFAVSATATNACGSVSAEATHAVECLVPILDIEKVAPEVAVEGDTITYRLEVRNTGPVPVRDVVVRDELCSLVSYANEADPAPESEPAVGAIGGAVVWDLGLLDPGESVVLTFRVVVEECGAPCENLATVEGLCGTARAADSDVAVTQLDCRVGFNCPRTPGFWMQQVAQRGNGSQKYSKAEVTQIAECIDSKSEFLDWGDAFEGFKDAVNPPKPMNPFKQLRRHFSALLANVCAAELELQPSHGGFAALDPSTPISCGGVEARTIAELIEEIDEALVNGRSGKYGALLECADAINNGVGIGETCVNDGETEQRSQIGMPRAGPDLNGIELYRAWPNPFSQTTQLVFEVSGPSARVEVGVYDVSGRLVRRLAEGELGTGRHRVQWDGRDGGGTRVSAGMYFVRSRVGSIMQTTRVLFVR